MWHIRVGGVFPFWTLMCLFLLRRKGEMPLRFFIIIGFYAKQIHAFEGGIYMSISVYVIIGLTVFLLIVSLLIMGILYLSKKKSDNRTRLTIEITNLLKIHFEQENQKN